VPRTCATACGGPEVVEEADDVSLGKLAIISWEASSVRGTSRPTLYKRKG
jgi:hypothetical protein